MIRATTSMESVVQPRLRYEFLDGLRGLVALVVAAYHYTEAVGLHKAVPRGHLGVDFFFALSGFVLASAYEDRLKSSKMKFLDFFAQRLLRLYPMIIFGWLFAMFVLVLSGLTPGLGAATLNLLMLPSFVEQRALSPAFPINDPQWSLFFEIAINLIYAFSIKWLSNRVLISLWVASSALMVAITLKTFHTFNVGWSTDSFLAGFPRVSATFFAGVIIFRFRHILPFRIFGVPSVILLVLIITGIFFVQHISSGDGVIDVILALAAIPALLVMGSKVNLGHWGRNTCSFLSAISYPAYLIHFPICRLAAEAETVKAWLATYGATLIFLIALSVVSHLVFVYFDLPVRREISRVIKRISRVPIAAR